MSRYSQDLPPRPPGLSLYDPFYRAADAQLDTYVGYIGKNIDINHVNIQADLRGQMYDGMNHLSINYLCELYTQYQGTASYFVATEFVDGPNESSESGMPLPKPFIGKGEAFKMGVLLALPFAASALGDSYDRELSRGIKSELAMIEDRGVGERTLPYQHAVMEACRRMSKHPMIHLPVVTDENYNGSGMLDALFEEVIDALGYTTIHQQNEMYDGVGLIGLGIAGAHDARSEYFKGELRTYMTNDEQ